MPDTGEREAQVCTSPLHLSFDHQSKETCAAATMLCKRETDDNVTSSRGLCDGSAPLVGGRARHSLE